MGRVLVCRLEFRKVVEMFFLVFVVCVEVVDYIRIRKGDFCSLSFCCLFGFKKVFKSGIFFFGVKNGIIYGIDLRACGYCYSR